MTRMLSREIGTAGTQENTTGITYQRNTIVTIKDLRKRGERQTYIVSTRSKQHQVSTNDTTNTT
jgi:hypothetical protein